MRFEKKDEDEYSPSQSFRKWRVRSRLVYFIILAFFIVILLLCALLLNLNRAELTILIIFKVIFLLVGILLSFFLKSPGNTDRDPEKNHR